MATKTTLKLPSLAEIISTIESGGNPYSLIDNYIAGIEDKRTASAIK